MLRILGAASTWVSLLMLGAAMLLAAITKSDWARALLLGLTPGLPRLLSCLPRSWQDFHMRGEARYPDGQMTWALRITGTLLCLVFARIHVFNTPFTCGLTGSSFAGSTTTSRLLPTPGPSTTPDPSTSRQAPSLRGAAHSTTTSPASSSMAWVSTPTTTSPAGPRDDGSQASQPVRRKPAARATRPHEACPGRPGLPCTWHTSQAGGRGEQRCPCAPKLRCRRYTAPQGGRGL